MTSIPPSLKELKERQCSPEELQSALILLIEKHNQLEEKIYRMEKEGRIRSAQEVSMTRRYGL